MLGPPVRGILEEGFRFIEGNIFTGFCMSVAVDPSSPTSDI